MDPVTNPYAPGAGSQPPELAGRGDIIEKTRIALARVKKGYSAKSLMLVGLRGVGKTVLLNHISSMAQNEGYIAVMGEAQENKSLPELLIPALRRILIRLDSKERVNERVKRALMVLKGFANSVKIKIHGVDIGLNIEAELGTADSGDLESDLAELFQAVGEAAKSQGQAVAIIIDELQYLTEGEFAALIMAVHRVSQQQLPVILIGAGLPQLVGLAGKAKSYAERLFDYPDVGALSEPDAREALTEPARREGVQYEGDALDEIYHLTKGYPYFVQEWGYNAWNVADKSPITLDDVKEAGAVSTKKLDESFFRVRFDRLTPREKEYLFSMAHIGPGPHRSGDVAKSMDVTVESIAPTRGSLIKKGMIYSPSHGDTAFTVPMFDEYLKRVFK